MTRELRRRILVLSVLFSFVIGLAPLYPTQTAEAATSYSTMAACQIGYDGLYPGQNPPNGVKCIKRNGSSPAVYLYFNWKLFSDQQVIVYGKPEAVNGESDWSSGKWQDSVTKTKYTSRIGIHPYLNKNGDDGEYRYYGIDVNGNLYTNMFFPDDARSGVDPSSMKYVYRPWENRAIMNGVNSKPLTFGPFWEGLNSADDIYISNQVLKANKMIKTNALRLKYQALPDTYTDNKPSKNLFDYMYVDQAPSSQAMGAGRLYHQNANDAIWYQTLPIEKLGPGDKKKLGVKATIMPSDSGNKYNTDLTKMNEKEIWTFHLDGEIKDDSVDFTKPFEVAANYTRLDIEKWELGITYSYPGGTYSETLTSDSGDKLALKKAKKIASRSPDLKIPIDRTKIKNGNTLSITLVAKAYYFGNTSPDTATTTKTYTFNGSEPIDIQSLTPVEDPIVPPLYCTPTMPRDAFDIVSYPASDSTDTSRIESRSVSVDGVSVDADQFFSGNYVFGDAADGLHAVSVSWMPIPGQEKGGTQGCEQTKWINVHDTKPRAQFKLNGGTFKENRKMTIDNTSSDPNANDPFVQAAYPIVNANWSWAGLVGSDADRRMKVEGMNHKEFLYNKPGEYQLTLTVTNTLGRTSDPYVLPFTVIDDYTPAVIAYPYSSQISRTESLQLFYDAVSTDGDIIKNQKVQVYYDVNNNETYSQLIDTFTSQISQYKPSINKLGRYRMVFTVDEDFGQATFPEFITAADKRVTVKQFEFMVDNYIPYADIYTDIPSIRRQVDHAFLLDKNMAQSKIDYVNANGVTINNQMRYMGIDPNVNVWDMHTYTYSQPASTSYNSGSSYPPSTMPYSSSGYSGTLNLQSASDNGYYYDYGGYQWKTDSKSASDSRSQSGSASCGSTVSSTIPSSVSYSDGTYSGTLGQSFYSYSDTTNPNCIKGKTYTGSYSFSRSASYSGTVYHTYQVWVPDVRWVSNWYGTYSGTIYKDVRAAYSNPYLRTTADRYLIYFSDTIINELPDFNYVKGLSDAKIILVGSAAIKSQSNYDYFIQNTGQPIDTIIQTVINYIASSNPPTAVQTVLPNEVFNLLTDETDPETDTIIQKQTMYVHKENYYDNPTGHAAFALTSYNASGWINETLRTSFALPGEYSIYRRVKDQPSTDPAFAGYSYWSNEAKTIVRVHRKPFAIAALDWTYDTNCSCYQTTWVDQSYDLDHNISDPVNKGIVERKIRYQLNGGEWYYQIPNNLVPGSYHLEYTVRDLEGAWSDPFIMDFTLAATPPPQLKAKLKSADPTFTLTGGIPASENLFAYELWTRFPLSVGLQFTMGSYVNKTVSYFTGKKTGSDITWNDEVTAIPATTPDGSYNYRIQANGSNGTSAFKDFTVKVLTPIQLVPVIRDAAGLTTGTIVVGYPFTIAADTTEYPQQVTVIAFKGKSFQQTRTLTGAVFSASGTGSKQWSVPFTLTGVIPDGTYTFEWTASTPNGNVEVRTLQIQLINNTPPFGNFNQYTYDAANTAMPIYEGDLLHIRSIGVGDNEHDPLTLRYEIMDPLGSKRYDATVNSLYPYTSAGPDYQIPGGSSATGTWTIRQTISDGKAAPVVRTQSMLVRSLGVQGYVNHTNAWETNRLHYNEKHPSTPRPSHWFWAGEAFALEATVTDTGTSGTKPISVKATATSELQKNLVAAAPQVIIWKELLREGDTAVSFKDLPQTNYSFVFKVTYNNGITKTSVVTIRLQDTVDDYVQVHRLQ